MIDERARSIVRSAGDGEKVVMILSWADRPQREVLDRLPYGRPRREHIDDFYRHAKSRALQIVAQAGVEIVNPLDGTPNAVVAAPGRVWRRLMDRGLLDDTENVTLFPDEEVEAQLG